MPQLRTQKPKATAEMKAMDTDRGADEEEEEEQVAMDHNATPRALRTRPRGIQTPAAAGIPLTPLYEMEMPALTSGALKARLETCEDESRLVSSTRNSTDSKARSRSPTKRMIDLRVAKKKVNQKKAQSRADIPEDVRELYDAIRSLAIVSRNGIPQEVEVRISTCFICFLC